MISISCGCGQTMRLSTELAGKKVRCPMCGEVLALSLTETLPDGLFAKAARPSDDEGFTHKPKSKGPRASGITNKPKSKPPADDEDGDDEPPSKQSNGNLAVSGKATAALICGLLTCCLPGLLSLPALIFGIMALMDISGSPDKLTGKGRAITGLVCGILGNGVGALLWFGIISTLFLGGIAAVLGTAVVATQEKAAKEKKANAEKMKADEQARKDEAKAMMTKLGAGAKKHLDTKGFYASPADNNLSWRVSILPYVEQEQLYKQFDLNSPFNSPKNKPLLKQIPPAFVSKFHGSRDNEKTTIQTTVGPNGFFRDAKEKLKLDQIEDGASNTIYIIDLNASFVPWTQPQDARIANGEKLPAGLGDQSFLVIMGDGAVRTVNRTKIDEPVLRQLLDRADGKGKLDLLE